MNAPTDRMILASLPIPPQDRGILQIAAGMEDIRAMRPLLEVLEALKPGAGVETALLLAAVPAWEAALAAGPALRALCGCGGVRADYERTALGRFTWRQWTELPPSILLH